MAGTGGVDSCRSSLLAFYNSSLPLSELTSGHWQESEMDHTLCKAGLWYTASSLHASQHCCCKSITCCCLLHHCKYLTTQATQGSDNQCRGCSRADTSDQPAASECADKSNGTVSAAFIIMASDNSLKGAVQLHHQNFAMLRPLRLCPLPDMNDEPPFKI